MTRGSLLLAVLSSVCASAERHPVPRDHPYLLGSRSELQALARQRPEVFQRVVQVAQSADADRYSRMISLGLTAAVREDAQMAQKLKELALIIVGGPIRQGHVPFATDLALCALAYDLTYETWSEPERRRFHHYVNQTVDANKESETHVFHNGWYGYKNWGIGLACYAAYHENERAPSILKALEEDYRTRAAPALELAGEGGGWAEGYYIHYWLYEWLFFCEVARRCEGIDYYAMAPQFYHSRALASAFEMYPGLSEYGSRRPIPMGDGGGRRFGGDRDKALAARRILVNYHRHDPVHQAIHTFNETTPRCSVGDYAYQDLLWRDPSVPAGDLNNLGLSHLSVGPGHVYARSSWDEDATYFFFKCGDRFTAHQHLDVGHFLIYQESELVGDGGHYDEFGSLHDVNYHLRTIAHNTVLVLDPEERWPGIRAGQVLANDGGQQHNWPHHNGAVADPQAWLRDKQRYDIADLQACQDTGKFLYVAGDASRAYSSEKLKAFTRQVLFLRPSTFVILDQVESTQPDYRKTWLLQAMQRPEQTASHLVISNGSSRLFVQTLLPSNPQVRLHSGSALYAMQGRLFPPTRDTGPAPACRIEISPSEPRNRDVFLHVLTVAKEGIAWVPSAQIRLQDEELLVDLGETRITLHQGQLGGTIQVGGPDRVCFGP